MEVSFAVKRICNPPALKNRLVKDFLLERLAERAITLKEGDVVPITDGTPPLDWGIVSGGITVLASAIEGLLGGRARIKAQQLKLLSPSPIDSETQDAIEYEVSLAAVIPQIQDLLGSSESEASGHPEFETPFTVLAREDSVRFAYKKERQEAHDKTVAGDDAFSLNAAERPQKIATEKRAPETPLERPALSLTALRTLSRPPANQPALPSEPPNGQQNETETLQSKTAIEREQNDQISSNETLPVVALESPNHVSDPVTQPEPVKVEPEVQLAEKTPGSDGDRRERSAPRRLMVKSA